MMSEYNPLYINLNGIKFNNPFLNASGAKCMEDEELKLLYSSSSGAYISKSCTLNQRSGNDPIRYWDNEYMSINSMGLPNYGINYYINHSLKRFEKIRNNKILNIDESIEEDIRTIKFRNKPYFISMAGLTLTENMNMIDIFNKSDNSHISGIEFNLSCPNLIGHGQLGYDFESVEKYLDTIFEMELPDNKLYGVKLPPYFEINHFGEIADIINKYSKLHFTTCINSIANGLVINTDTEKPVIRPKSGFGGIGGTIVKPTALANVRQFYNHFTHLSSNKFIIGCGGVYTGEDAFHHILAGASLVSIGSCLMKDGLNVFDRVQEELIEIMDKKGYRNLDEFRGQLKEF